jgi:hypothetical protein
MAKRLRDFKRISFTAKTGELIREALVDKTFHDHFKSGKCHKAMRSKQMGQVIEPCIHETSGTLAIARLVESEIKIGTKRATLDIPDPYCTADADATIKLLGQLAGRLMSYAAIANLKSQTRDAIQRIGEEVQLFADRNPLVVLAEIAAEES